MAEIPKVITLKWVSEVITRGDRLVLDDGPFDAGSWCFPAQESD